MEALKVKWDNRKKSMKLQRKKTYGGLKVKWDNEKSMKRHRKKERMEA